MYLAYYEKGKNKMWMMDESVDFLKNYMDSPKKMMIFDIEDDYLAEEINDGEWGKHGENLNLNEIKEDFYLEYEENN